MASNTDTSSPVTRLLQWLLLAVVVAVGIANLYLLLQSRDQTGEATGAPLRNMSSEPIFVNVGPLTVNLQSDAYGQRLLYIGLTLQVANIESRDMLARHMPEVQSRLLMLLSGQNAEELIPAEGKQKLADAILATFGKPLAQAQATPDITAVLFTNFIVQ